MNDVRLDIKKQIPAKPEKPSPNECCGSGCNPCVFDYYYSALERWHEEYAEDVPNDDNG